MVCLLRYTFISIVSIKNDSIFQNDWVNNTVNSVNSNSSNFDVEDSNYGNLTSNKSTNDANFQNAWRVNTANTVNTLANHYKIDLENFNNQNLIN